MSSEPSRKRRASNAFAPGGTGPAYKIPDANTTPAGSQDVPAESDSVSLPSSLLTKNADDEAVFGLVETRARAERHRKRKETKYTKHIFQFGVSLESL